MSPTTSDTAARVAAILAGTAQTGNSVSSSREGGEPAVLHPANITKFRLAMEAMDAAHREGNDRKMDLLASLQKVVSLAHKAGKNQSPLEKSITKAWRVPDWLPATQYDQVEGKHAPLNFTIGQQCEYRERRNRRNRQQSIHRGAPKPLARQGSNTEYKALLLDMAEKLSHVIDGEPDPRLGMLGSIKHANHPELWRHWFNRWQHLKIDPEGFPYPQHIRGFRRIVPLMRTPRSGPLTAEDIQWQRWGVAKMLCVLAVPGWYKAILLKHCIKIDPQPSWESITFHDNMGDDNCTRFLAERGLTLEYFTLPHTFPWTP